MKNSRLLVAIISLMIFSCTKKEFTLEPTVVSMNEVLGKWKLVRYEDLEISENIAQPDVKIFEEMTITFKSDGTWHGRINCSSVYGDFVIYDGKMRLTKSIIPIVGCIDLWAENFYKVFEKPENSPHASVNRTILTLVSSNLKRKVTMEKQ